ncbi:addiction module toxin RelE [Aquabacterium sp.]|nr:addiction module toxin RelE [Aquabacterium sp.]MDD2976132.1 addiction module toxin RelE [Aquabacterium sp.]
MYYVERSGAIVIMLGGGDKASQQRDIEMAMDMAKELP